MLRERKDELGAISRSFTRMIGYQKDIAGIAQKIANGDLTVEIELKGENDLASSALKQMIASLRSLIEGVQQSALAVQAASNELSSAADQAGQATILPRPAPPLKELDRGF